jgi:hypothetical protein
MAAEDVLADAYIAELFPATIVRPSHTYDEAQPPELRAEFCAQGQFPRRRL